MTLSQMLVPPLSTLVLGLLIIAVMDTLRGDPPTGDYVGYVESVTTDEHGHETLVNFVGSPVTHRITVDVGPDKSAYGDWLLETFHYGSGLQVRVSWTTDKDGKRTYSLTPPEKLVAEAKKHGYFEEKAN